MKCLMHQNNNQLLIWRPGRGNRVFEFESADRAYHYRNVISDMSEYESEGAYLYSGVGFTWFGKELKEKDDEDTTTGD